MKKVGIGRKFQIWFSFIFLVSSHTDIDVAGLDRGYCGNCPASALQLQQPAIQSQTLSRMKFRQQGHANTSACGIELNQVILVREAEQKLALSQAMLTDSNKRVGKTILLVMCRWFWRPTPRQFSLPTCKQCPAFQRFSNSGAPPPMHPLSTLTSTLQKDSQ